jgi:hypothetical protein
MLEQIADALVQSWRNFATAVALFVPRLIAALIIIAIGWAIAAAARAGVRRLLLWVRFERFAQRSGASEMLRRAEMPPADALIASFVFWVVLIGFLVSAVDALEFRTLDGLVQGFLLFLPRLVVALVILALGFLVGNFVWRAALLASVNAGLPSARLVSSALRLLVIALSAAMALEQVGLATSVVLTAFAIAFGAVMLGLAIAFGLGGRDAARHVLEQQIRQRDTKDADLTPHL